MKNDPVEKALAALDAAAPEELAKAFRSRWNLVVAKAARLAAEQNLTSLLPQTEEAFNRFLPDGGVKEGQLKDKGCAALTALARALVAFDCDDAGLFRRGMKYVQMEPAWLRPEDAAVELRATCAIGLANTRDSRRLRDMVYLLTDKEWRARAGAARAIAAVGGEPAILLLRFKVLTGDEHDDVLYDCFAGLIELEGAECMPFLRELATEPAILALGASRRPDALSLLLELHSQTYDPARAACILLAISSSRLEEAIDFLLEQIRTAPSERAKAAKEAMSLHRHDPRIAARLCEAAEQRAASL